MDEDQSDDQVRAALPIHRGCTASVDTEDYLLYEYPYSVAQHRHFAYMCSYDHVCKGDTCLQPMPS